MASMVLDRTDNAVYGLDELSEVIKSYVGTDKVELAKGDDGKVTLMPMSPERRLAFLKTARQAFKGTGWSSENFLRNKRYEKALEG